MSLKLRSVLAVTAASILLPIPAFAQDIVMRRPIPMSMSVDGGAAWKTTPWIIYDQSGHSINVKDACGDYVERRQVFCGKSDGTKIEELYCRGQTKPIAEQPMRHDEGCTYSWTSGDWRDPGPSCSLKEAQDRDVKCLRDTDKVAMAESFCAGVKPDVARTVEDFATCTYTWRNGQFVDPGNSCTNTEKQDRQVWCERDLDRTVATAESLCDPSKKPDGSQSVRDISACTYSWKSGDFVDAGDSCTRSETQTRDVTCHRSLNDELADDSACTAAKPNTTTTVEDYRTCSFKAVQPTKWTPSSTCSATATKTRTFKCQRSNDGGEIVDDAQCQKAGVPLTETVPEANYSTCSHSWSYGEFGDPGASCSGVEPQSRVAWCKRDLDQFKVDDAMCAASVREPLTRTVADYSGCQPYWYAASGWSDWSSYCSTSSTRNREIGCFRFETGCTQGSANYWADAGNGNCYRKIDNAQCTAFPTSAREGYNPSMSSESAALYSSCTNSWSQTGFVDPGPNCGNETWTQGVTCTRDLDKQVMGDGACSAAKPSSTDVRYDVSNCGYTAVNWTDWTYASTCSANTSRTQTAQCLRGDGQIVDGAECTNRGVSLTRTEAGQSNYSTCSNSWSYSAFVDPGASCTANEIRNRTTWCKRDLDGAVMGDAACAGKAQEALSMNAGADYSGCGYTAVNPGGWTWNSTCSATAVRTRTYECRRGDGTIVAGAECTNRGVGITESVQEANYSSCTNSWDYSAFVDPGASCSSAETLTRTARCRRDLDNATMADGACGARQPLTTTQADYSGCTFTPHDHGYGACDGTNRPHYWDCLRSDGTDGHAAALCGHQNPEYENCYSYQAQPTQSSCSSGQATVTNNCRRSDGAMVAASFCGLPATQQTSCSSYRWVTGGYGGFGACQADNRQLQYRDVYCEANNGGNLSRVDGSLCSNAGLGAAPTNVNAQGCEYYSYSVGAGWGWSDWMSHCSHNTYREQGHSCIRSPDGYVDNNYSSNQCTARGMVTYDRQNAAVYDGCGYTASYGGFGACQPNNTQTQGMSLCTRSIDGASVAGDECVARGQPWTRSQACNYYSYGWEEAGWTGYDSSCSSSTTRHMQYSCVRYPDRAVVPDAYCGGKPARDDTPVANYASCGYTPGYGSFGACDGSNRYAPITSCLRSNGDYVGTAECTNRGSPANTAQACTLSCSWARGGSGYGSSSAATSWGSSRMPTSMSTIPWVYYSYSTGGSTGGPDYISNAPNPGVLPTCNPSMNGVYGTAFGMQRYNGNYPSVTGQQNFYCGCS